MTIRERYERKLDDIRREFGNECCYDISRRVTSIIEGIRSGAMERDDILNELEALREELW